MIEYALGALVASVIWLIILGIQRAYHESEATAFQLAKRYMNIENVKQRKKAAELRRVLEMVEWEPIPPGIVAEALWVCPWCKKWEQDGHGRDCPRQAALGESDAKTID